jgi:large subunit ribosomal protein L23
VSTAATKLRAARKKAGTIRSTEARAVSKERLMNVLLAPHVTEKTSLAMQNANQYTFRVRTRRDQARDQGCRRADVRGQGRRRERRQRDRQDAPLRQAPGRTQDWKKAYVKLADGQSIDYEASRKA